MIQNENDINDRNIEAYLDKPNWMPGKVAVSLLLAIELDSDKYLTTPKRFSVYSNLKDSVELFNVAIGRGWTSKHN